MLREVLHCIPRSLIETQHVAVHGVAELVEQDGLNNPWEHIRRRMLPPSPLAESEHPEAFGNSGQTDPPSSAAICSRSERP